MEKIYLNRVTDIELKTIDYLVDESLSQGFQFVERLVREYRSGLNRFNKPGEILITASVKDKVIGIGGLNQDPYSNNSQVGRLRHLYVESAWRRSGVGQLLVKRLLAEAQQHYQLLTLRTGTLEADRFYRKLGFKTDPIIKYATHYLTIDLRATLPLKL